MYGSVDNAKGSVADLLLYRVVPAGWRDKESKSHTCQWTLEELGSRDKEKPPMHSLEPGLRGRVAIGLWVGEEGVGRVVPMFEVRGLVGALRALAGGSHWVVPSPCTAAPGDGGAAAAAGCECGATDTSEAPRT